MNANTQPEEDFADIENALRRLTPRAPGALCEVRIAAALDGAAIGNVIPFRRFLAWGAGIAAAAACIAAVVTVSIGNLGTAGNSAATAATVAAPAAESTAPAASPLLAAADAGRRAPDAAALATAPAIAPTVPTAPAASPSPASALAASQRRAPASIEPLQLRRASDGRFYQPYRVRYPDASTISVGASSGTRGRALPANVPQEEIHFVKIELI